MDELRGEREADRFAIFGAFGNPSHRFCGIGYDLAGFIEVTDCPER